MKDEEKLQRLVEIAWENGYRGVESKDVKSNEKWGDPTPYFWNDKDHEVICTMETVLFDHEFINALCRAKYGEKHEEMINLTFETPSQIMLQDLAISDNRIEYLWETFGGENEKESQKKES